MDVDTEYAIVPAQPSHLPFLPAIEVAAAACFPSDSMPEDVRIKTVPMEEYTEGQNRGNLWVALDGKNVVGFALLEIFEGFALLEEVDVRPEYARRGIGRKLVTQALEGARKAGITDVYLTTFEHLPWNAPFYQTFGFEKEQPEKLPAFVAKTLQNEVASGLTHRTAMHLHLTKAAA